MISGPADPKSSQAQPSWVVGPPVPPAARLGQLIDGEFQIKGILGQGELGVTYESDNTRLKRRFAVLMLGRGLKPTHGMMLAVRDDLRRAQQLTSAGIMPVKLIADRDGIPGFATELLEGETLRGRLGRGPLRAERALALVIGVARTLEAAHKVGMIHGDLRPENIFLVRPTAKSTFAGKAMLVEHALHHLRRRTPGLDDRLPLYKLMYRPPEQVLGEAGASEQADVWVLGAILFECLTGKPAFYAEEPEFVLDNLGSPPPPLTQNLEIGLTEHLASALNVLIASACARDLDSRVPNMSEFIEGLDQIVAGSEVKLPEVVVESREEAAAAQAPATQPNRRMNRLLQRLSGVFPQIQLPGPPSQPPPGASGELPAATPAAATSGSAMAPVNLAADGPVSMPKMPAQLQPIVPPKERVSRILQKLSGAYPAISPTPPEGVEPMADDPPADKSGPAPAVSAKAAPQKLGSDTPTPKMTDLDRALQILKKQRGDGQAPAPAQRPVVMPAYAATSSAPGFRPTVPPIDPADLAPFPAPAAPVIPVVPVAPVVPIAPVVKQPEPSTKTPPPPSTQTPPPAKVEAAPPSAKTPPPSAKTPPPPAKVEAATASAKTPSPLAKVEAVTTSAKTPPPTSTKTPPLASMKTPPLPSMKTPPISVLTPAPPSSKTPAIQPTVPTGPIKAPVAKAEPAPSQKSPPAKQEAAPQSTRSPVSQPESAATQAKPATPEPLKPAMPVQATAAEPPAMPQQATLFGGEAPLPSAKSPVAPSEAVSPSSKSPIKTAAPPPSSQSPQPTADLERPTVKPRDVSISSAETPRAGLLDKAAKKQSDIALDATLWPEDLAEVIEASQPGMPVPGTVAAAEKSAADAHASAQPLPPLHTMSEIPTNPALAAMVEKLSPIKPGRPALTEQATQPALRRLPITEQATQAHLDQLPLNELATQARLEALPPLNELATQAKIEVLPLAELATQAKYTLPSDPEAVKASPPATPGEPPVTAAPPPPTPAAADKPRPQRPPRVSQLIAAIQAQQGPPPAAPVTPEPVAPGRRSPGLIAPAPDILASSSPTVSSSGTGANEALASQPEPPSPVSWVLRHQEAVAALVGALLVILGAFLYIFLRS